LFGHGTDAFTRDLNTRTIFCLDAGGHFGQAPEPPSPERAREECDGQIRFCKSLDGVRIAYARTGQGSAMVEVATGINHLSQPLLTLIRRAALA
jgi:hypothetical protein